MMKSQNSKNNFFKSIELTEINPAYYEKLKSLGDQLIQIKNNWDKHMDELEVLKQDITDYCSQTQAKINELTELKKTYPSSKNIDKHLAHYSNELTKAEQHLLKTQEYINKAHSQIQDIESTVDPFVNKK